MDWMIQQILQVLTTVNTDKNIAFITKLDHVLYPERAGNSFI